MAGAGGDGEAAAEQPAEPDRASGILRILFVAQTIMLQARRISTPLLCAGLRALSCCAAAEGLPTAAAQPGTVSEYSQHVLVRLPGSASAAADGLGAAWPPLVEKEPAVLAAFQAVARSQERGLVAGTVKITAFQDLAGSAQQQQRQQQLPAAAGVGASVLAFPAGLRWDGLSAEQVGLAVALATADNPNTAPLRDSERRQLAALEVGARGGCLPWGSSRHWQWRVLCSSKLCCTTG